MIQLHSTRSSIRCGTPLAERLRCRRRTGHQRRPNRGIPTFRAISGACDLRRSTRRGFTGRSARQDKKEFKAWIYRDFFDRTKCSRALLAGRKCFDSTTGLAIASLACSQTRQCPRECRESTRRPAPKKPHSNLASFLPCCKPSQSTPLAERPLPKIAHL
jgi:hypothetical protein